MWRWVKVPKVIAVIAFFLPWLTVSCSSTVLLTASGWSLATGHLSVVNPLTGAVEAQQGEPNYWLIAALIVIVIGLAAALVRSRAAPVVLLTSLAALALVVGGTHRFSDRLLRDEIAKHRTGTQIDKLADRIRIDRQIGFWIELAALVTAAAMAGLVLTGRSRVFMRIPAAGLAEDDDATLP